MSGLIKPLARIARAFDRIAKAQERQATAMELTADAAAHSAFAAVNQMKMMAERQDAEEQMMRAIAAMDPDQGDVPPDSSLN